MRKSSQDCNKWCNSQLGRCAGHCFKDVSEGTRNRGKTIRQPIQQTTLQLTPGRLHAAGGRWRSSDSLGVGCVTSLMDENCRTKKGHSDPVCGSGKSFHEKSKICSIVFGLMQRSPLTNNASQESLNGVSCQTPEHSWGCDSHWTKC